MNGRLRITSWICVLVAATVVAAPLAAQTGAAFATAPVLDTPSDSPLAEPNAAPTASVPIDAAALPLASAASTTGVGVRAPLQRSHLDALESNQAALPKSFSSISKPHKIMIGGAVLAVVGLTLVKGKAGAAMGLTGMLVGIYGLYRTN